MRTARIGTVLVVAGMLSLLMLASAPAQACSLTGSPTGCATEIYKAQKASVTSRTNEAAAYVGILPGSAVACPDAALVITPPGIPGVPGLDPIQQYGANVSGDAMNPSISAPLTIFAGLGETVNEAYFGAVDVVLHYDGTVTDIVLPFVPDTSDLQNLQVGVPDQLPTLPDPNAGIQGAQDYANAQLTLAQAQAGETIGCLTALAPL